jgi:hypothetical protein
MIQSQHAALSMTQYGFRLFAFDLGLGMKHAAQNLALHKSPWPTPRLAFGK